MAPPWDPPKVLPELPSLNIIIKKTFKGKKKNMTGRKHDEGVPESVWKRYKSKDLNFLHRSCTPQKMQTKNKNVFFAKIKKNAFLFLIFVLLFC